MTEYAYSLATVLMSTAQWKVLINFSIIMSASFIVLEHV